MKEGFNWTKSTCALLQITLIFGTFACNNYPVKNDVDLFFQGYISTDLVANKQLLLDGMLEKLAPTQTGADGQLLQEFMVRLARLYEQGHDDSILQTLENSDHNGEMPFGLCTFYAEVLDDRVFLETYRNDSARAERLRGGPMSMCNPSLINAIDAAIAAIGSS
ncbi:MAG: hypothetical protein ABL878_19360 [Burkholderiales bacterium]